MVSPVSTNLYTYVGIVPTTGSSPAAEPSRLIDDDALVVDLELDPLPPVAVTVTRQACSATRS